LKAIRLYHNTSELQKSIYNCNTIAVLLAQTVRNATKKLKDKIDYDIIFLWTCKYLCAEFYNHIEAGDPNFRGESLIQ